LARWRAARLWVDLRHRVGEDGRTGAARVFRGGERCVGGGVQIAVVRSKGCGGGVVASSLRVPAQLPDLIVADPHRGHRDGLRLKEPAHLEKLKDGGVVWFVATAAASCRTCRRCTANWARPSAS